jgi:hypothetical protein
MTMLDVTWCPCLCVRCPGRPPVEPEALPYDCRCRPVAPGGRSAPVMRPSSAARNSPGKPTADRS